MLRHVDAKRHLSIAVTCGKSLIKIVMTLFTVALAIAIKETNGSELTIGVAANFTTTFKQLEQEFEQHSGHKVTPSFGSTGQLYAQILHGAPFDLFLAADAKRVDMLVEQHRAVGPSSFIYAQGKLVLLSTTDKPMINGSLLSQHPQHSWRLAIANPKLAPYGLAAVETLQALGVYSKLKAHLIIAQNIAQTMQFVASGSIDLGFVALSQVLAINGIDSNQYWLVPAEMYQPINQKAVLLNRGINNSTAKEFLTYLRSDNAISIIRSHGYSTVPVTTQTRMNNVISTQSTPSQP